MHPLQVRKNKYKKNLIQKNILIRYFYTKNFSNWKNVLCNQSKCKTQFIKCLMFFHNFRNNGYEFYNRFSTNNNNLIRFGSNVIFSTTLICTLKKKNHMVAFKDIILHFSLSTTFFFLTIYQNYIFFATDWAIDAFRVCFITLVIEIPYAAPKCRAVSGIRFYNLTNLFWNWVYYKNPFADIK